MVHPRPLFRLHYGFENVYSILKQINVTNKPSSIYIGTSLGTYDLVNKFDELHLPKFVLFKFVTCGTSRKTICKNNGCEGFITLFPHEAYLAYVRCNRLLEKNLRNNSLFFSWPIWMMIDETKFNHLHENNNWWLISRGRHAPWRYDQFWPDWLSAAGTNGNEWSDSRFR